jgi:hypothetical protein
MTTISKLHGPKLECDDDKVKLIFLEKKVVYMYSFILGFYNYSVQDEYMFQFWVFSFNVEAIFRGER